MSSIARPNDEETASLWPKGVKSVLNLVISDHKFICE